MRTFRLNKVVRDRIVPDMRAKGQEVVTRRLRGKTFLRAMGEKILEEIAEFTQGEPNVTELVDIAEAAEATRRTAVNLAQTLGVSAREFERLQAERREEKGGFATGTYVATVSVAEDDEWAAYYAREPERFPEVTG